MNQRLSERKRWQRRRWVAEWNDDGVLELISVKALGPLEGMVLGEVEQVLHDLVVRGRAAFQAKQPKPAPHRYYSPGGIWPPLKRKK